MFIKVINFLIHSVALTGIEKAIALQSVDTLLTIVSDTDLIPRLAPHLPSIIKTLCECNIRISIKLYLIFVQDFIKYYHNQMSETGCCQEIVPFVHSLVQGIMVEIKGCHERGDRNNLIIN